MPIRGRYVNIALLVDAERAAPGPDADRAPNMFLARLEARGDRLVAVQDDENGRHWVRSARCGERRLLAARRAARVFHPGTRDRSLAPARGAALWAEVTLPPTGAPRPIRLGPARGDASDADDARRILVLDGHPDPRGDHFVHGLATAYRESALAAGP